MNVRSVLGSLQLPVAAGGALVLAGALYAMATVPVAPAQSDGFVQGLAVLFLGALAYGGFVVLALGLAIPPMGGYGIRFSRAQRILFGAAAGLVLAGLVLPFVGFGLLYGAAMDGDATPLLLLWVAPTLLGVLALVAGLLWRAAEAVGPRVRQVSGSSGGP